MNKAIIVAFALWAVSSSAAAANLDIFPGTVLLEGQQLVLTRCDLAHNRYILVDKQGRTDTLVKRLPAEITDTKKQVSVQVIAEYREKDGQQYLYVDDLAEISVGKSCHLLDAFGGANK